MTRHALLFPVLATLATPAMSEVIALMPSDSLDGPYIEASAVSPDMLEPMTPARVAQMSDLDGDPTVTTAEEKEMIALLSQVLTITPLEN